MTNHLTIPFIAPQVLSSPKYVLGIPIYVVIWLLKIYVEDYLLPAKSLVLIHNLIGNQNSLRNLAALY